MLIAQMWEPFDDPEWNGCRCITYLEQDRVILRNKRNMELLPRFIEQKDIYKQVNDRCILDGEPNMLGWKREEKVGFDHKMLVVKAGKLTWAKIRLKNG